MKTLVVYFSKYGQTEAIAKRIANILRGDNHEVATINALTALSLDSLESFDTVILGSPIYTGKHSKHLKRFIKKQLNALQKANTAFFSVSLSAAGGASQCDEATACMNSFLESCRWSPDAKAIFAGSLPYRRYNVFVRWLMKRIVRKAGGDTDTSRDYEYTKWNEVEAFAQQVGHWSNRTDRIAC